MEEKKNKIVEENCGMSFAEEKSSDAMPDQHRIGCKKTSDSVKQTKDKDQQRRFEDENRRLFILSAVFGIIAVKRINGKYVLCKLRFVMYYLIWMLWPLAGLFIAIFTQARFLGPETDELMGNNVLECMFIILCFAVVPSIQACTLKYINLLLPEVLEDIANLCDIDVGFKTPLKAFRMHSMEKKRDKQRLCKQLNSERLIQWFPLAMIFLSVTALSIVWFIGFNHIVDLDAMKQELPLLTLNGVYLAIPSFTTIIVISFIIWLTRVYHKLYRYCAKRSGSWSKAEVVAVCVYVDKLQDIFTKLSEGFFMYTLGTNLVIVAISAVMCTAKLLQDDSHAMYLIPVMGDVIIVTLACKNGAHLMHQYDHLLTVVNSEVRRSRNSPSGNSCAVELTQLRQHLLESPPQVVTFGGYKTNYGLLVTMLGFILSYAVLIHQVTCQYRSNVNQDQLDHILQVIKNVTASGKCLVQCLVSSSPS